MDRARFVFFITGFLLLSSSIAMAQFPVLDAEQVKAWMEGGKKFVLIDARPAKEYQEAHIPGAINIMPEKVREEAARLPKDKAAPIIFYCRGME